MSILSTLQFGDNESGNYTESYKITHCHCRFNRTYDCCMPHSDAKCEQIEMTVVVPDNSDLSIVGWYIENTPLNGRLQFADSDNDTDTGNESSIEFENAYCVSLSETYEIGLRTQRQMSIVIVPMRIKMNGIEFVRPRSKRTESL